MLAVLLLQYTVQYHLKIETKEISEQIQYVQKNRKDKYDYNSEETTVKHVFLRGYKECKRDN